MEQITVIDNAQGSYKTFEGFPFTAQIWQHENAKTAQESYSHRPQEFEDLDIVTAISEMKAQQADQSYTVLKIETPTGSIIAIEPRETIDLEDSDKESETVQRLYSAMGDRHD